LDLLGSGGRVRNNAGDDVELSEVDVDNCILDLRNLNSDAEVWFSQTRRRIKDRTGLDINRDVVPITATIAATTGGAPIDEHGRVTIEEGNRWATGLYAAGRSANSGAHGVGLLSGNLLLDDLVGGQAAGTHAGEWVQNASFGGSSLVSEAQNAAQDRIEALQNGVGHSVGQTAATLISIMSNSVNGSRDESSLKAAKQALTNLSAAGIRVTDGTSVMNMELATALKLEGMLTLADSIIDA
jgi:succinate dehydrogenase/fumarate reductase flavoprotein subunit